MLNHQQVSIEGLEARLNQLQSTQPELQVQLLSDGDTPVAWLATVVDQIKTAKFSQISVSQFSAKCSAQGEPDGGLDVGLTGINQRHGGVLLLYQQTNFCTAEDDGLGALLM